MNVEEKTSNKVNQNKYLSMWTSEKDMMEGKRICKSAGKSFEQSMGSCVLVHIRWTNYFLFIEPHSKQGYIINSDGLKYTFLPNKDTIMLTW